MAAVAKACAAPRGPVRPGRVPTHCTRASAAAGLVGLLFAAGCSSSAPSYADLAEIARAVPVPAGLTYVREVDHVNHAEFGGTDQKEVDFIYANTTMSCEQLSAAWRAVVEKARRHIDTADSGNGPGAFYLKSGGALITVDPGGSTGACPQPRVAVGKTP